MSLTVLAPGLMTSVQDGGRCGYAGIGVGTAGAMDAIALRLANILVGNVENAAALEITLRGPRLRFERDSLIALAGAPVEARVDATAVPMWRPVAMHAGSELDLGAIRRGARAYLAVSGGIETPRVLGSRSADLNGGIGPQPLASGDVLPLGREPAAPIAAVLLSDLTARKLPFAAAKWSLDPAPWFDADLSQPLRAVAGSHLALLDAQSRHALFMSRFSISADSNRVGYRLDGARLMLRAPLELISAGLVPGTMQLPPNGAPIVLMAEAPTSGGYPRILHVVSTDMPRLAQCRPGDSICFTEISLAEAQTRYLEREEAIAAVAHTIDERLYA